MLKKELLGLLEDVGDDEEVVIDNGDYFLYEFSVYTGVRREYTSSGPTIEHPVVVLGDPT